MARARKPPARKAASRSRNGTGLDAIALLKADHREVQGWFDQFQKTKAEERQKTLVDKICKALKVHTAIEEEIFYPAFLEATDQEDMHHEAEVEHESAKKLIAEIEAMEPSDDYYSARVKVLSEMIKHHVNEEEQRDGMFAKAKQSDMDLQGLGQQLKARKSELMAGTGEKPRGGMLSHLLGRESSTRM